jgi:SAM-dependent methyltransferase
MVDQALARSFEGIGVDYDRYRPGFPPAAVAAMLPEPVAVAVDLGAGTGKFTELLVGRADRVVAVEPSVAMLDVLRQKLPEAAAIEGSAESIPLANGSADIVTVAQAFHWFDRDPACAEIRRVLVDHGTLGLLWNSADPGCEWDHAAHRVAHPAVSQGEETTASAAAELPGFSFVERSEIRWQERISRADYLSRWLTVSSFLVADEDSRASRLAEIERILDEAPETRGRDEFDLPHLTTVYVYRRA